MPHPLSPQESVGMTALLAAERVLLQLDVRSKNAAYGFKAHREIVTHADRAANRVILETLRKGTPDYDILSEEGSLRTRSPWRWIVDPLDGTTNYAARLPLWGISIALAYQGDVRLGLISLPALGERYVARKDGGAWRSFSGTKGQTTTLKRIHVSKVSALRDSLGLACFGYVAANKRALMSIEPTLAYRSRSIRHLGAAVIEASWVASGRADYSILTGVRPWDVAAGALLVREAGGRVLTPSGREWTLDHGRVLFVTPGVERSVVAITRRV
ncbi:MAG: inositol monophosphatase family protein [Patescibacteria group bacterium]